MTDEGLRLRRLVERVMAEHYGLALKDTYAAAPRRSLPVGSLPRWS